MNLSMKWFSLSAFSGVGGSKQFLFYQHFSFCWVSHYQSPVCMRGRLVQWIAVRKLKLAGQVRIVKEFAMKESNLFPMTMRSAFQLNFYGHVAAAELINVHFGVSLRFNNYNE